MPFAETLLSEKNGICARDDGAFHHTWLISFRRTLSNTEKQNYIAAVQCLQKAPAKTGSTYAGVRSRFDDFQAEHINRTDFIHFVGFFQP